MKFKRKYAVCFLIAIAMLSGCSNSEVKQKDSSKAKTENTQENTQENEEDKKEEKDVEIIGTWYLTSGGAFVDSTIEISKTDKENMLNIYIESYDGGQMGMFEGNAQIKDGIITYEEEEFRFEMKVEDNNLILKSEDGVWPMFGMGVSADGEYGREKKEEVINLVDLGVLDSEEELKTLKEITKDSFEIFESGFQIIMEEKNLDEFKARVYSGGVKGLYSIMESIVMISEEEMWAATIDGDTILYATTDSSSKEMPKTIKAWADRLEGKTIRTIE